MEDETFLLDGKGLINMRVVDLKQELEKRGLSKSGSKKDLVKRLKQQLEFEKLSEERKLGDSHPKLELDAEIQQNEFVQQYLAQQQKRYAERQEEKRLQLEGVQKCQEEGSTIISEHEVDENASDDAEDEDDKEQNLIEKPFEKEPQSLNTDYTNVTPMKSIEPSKAQTSKCESETEILEEKNISPHCSASVCHTDMEINCEQTELIETDGNQNIIKNLSNIIKIKDMKSSPSKCLSETETKSLIPTEHEATDNQVCLVNNTDNIKEQKDFKAKICNQSLEEKDSNIAIETCTEEHTESGKIQSSTSEETENKISYCVSPERKNLPKQKSVENMEVSDCSSVPYSLSDIQLPESPSYHVKSKDAKSEERSETDYMSNEETTENSMSDNKSKSNGETVHNLNSSQDDDVSDSETKDSSHSNDSPKKIKETKVKRHSDESSDVESDKNNSSLRKKSFKYEDTSSNLAADSDNDCSKDTLSKEQKYIKAEQNTDESDDDKSSDSEKYNRHVDSKCKSRDKPRKRDSRSSSSSSSKSSDSSPERRRSKKPIVTESKDFIQDDESNQISDKSSGEKSENLKKNDSVTESTAVISVSIKKRLKIKRDNVPYDIPPSAKESLKISTSIKNIEKNESIDSASDKSTKQESHEVRIPIKEEKPEVSLKSKKLVPLNRKLNRNTSEETNTEPKSKRGKWESFASGQKSSQEAGISSDSLRNWFPDFKLITETSVEIEQDEHSSSNIDEKNDDLAQADTLNENESSIKHESTSQMDIEDSVSQEPNFNDSAEQGPVSKIIFIQNLVRPFTLNQLKDLLKQNGKIIEEYFWIDKIKSKCFAMYETEKEAIRTRNALNNTRWPSSNPKILSVEFSSVEELENHKKGNEPQPIKPPEPPAVESSDIMEARVSHTIEEHKRKDRERRKEKDRAKIQAPVREWDKDKIIQDSPERERPPKEKSKSVERKEKKESKKRATEDTPAKLLDDLFQKTKSVPCIYWLPLNEEQAKVKEEERKMKRLEREKRNQELKEQEAERRNRRARSSSRRREKENRKSSTRSRSPVSRRR